MTTEVIVTGTGVPHLVLTHLGPAARHAGRRRALRSRCARAGGYEGRVTVAEDLATFTL
ncbi:MAG TPA: hypothetical protein VGO03_04830 [Acidimicrobiia bacterium]|jgi:hypothetical protein